MSERRRAEAPERAAVREIVLVRAGRQCEAIDLVPEVSCWHPDGRGALDVHEIVPRSAWRAGYLDPDNCLALCRAHHDWIDHHPERALALGLRGRKQP